MTQREAYERVQALLNEIALLEKQHDLLIGMRERDSLPEILDPDLYTVEKGMVKNWRGEMVERTTYVFKKHPNEEQLAKLREIFYDDDEWLEECVLGQDVYATNWIPSQYC